MGSRSVIIAVVLVVSCAVMRVAEGAASPQTTEQRTELVHEKQADEKIITELRGRVKQINVLLRSGTSPTVAEAMSLEGVSPVQQLKKLILSPQGPAGEHYGLGDERVHKPSASAYLIAAKTAAKKYINRLDLGEGISKQKYISGFMSGFFEATKVPNPMSVPCGGGVQCKDAFASGFAAGTGFLKSNTKEKKKGKMRGHRTAKEKAVADIKREINGFVAKSAVGVKAVSSTADAKTADAETKGTKHTESVVYMKRIVTRKLREGMCH